MKKIIFSFLNKLSEKKYVVLFILFLISFLIFYSTYSQGQTRYTIFRTYNEGFKFYKGSSYAPILIQTPDIGRTNVSGNQAVTIDYIRNIINFNITNWVLLDFFNQDIQPPSVRSFNVTIGDPRGSKIKIIGGNYYPFDRDTLRYDWRGLSEGVYNINLSGFGISRCLSAFASPINVDQGIHRDIVAHIGDCTSQRLEIILSRPPRNDAPVHGFTWMIIAE